MVVTHRNHTAITAGHHIIIKDPGGETVISSNLYDGSDLRVAIDKYLALYPYLRDGWGSGKWGAR